MGGDGISASLARSAEERLGHIRRYVIGVISSQSFNSFLHGWMNVELPVRSIKELSLGEDSQQES